MFILLQRYNKLCLIKIQTETKFKLELMFMKHYAPNRCLYIKGGGVGSVLVGGVGGGGFGFGGGVRVDVNKELKFL